MGIRERLSGNEAVSYAIKQINPDVMPAFPITPSTEIPQFVSTYISNGEIDTEFIPVESEHSAMSAAIGASAAGCRVLTATSSCGMALMWEELYVAASNRLPIALALVNRALSGPININCDHSDSMGARDTGWIQIYAENNQEAYDNFIQAYPIAEDKRVHLPIMICQDGFVTSHAVENIELLEDELVKDFVGEYEPEEYLLNPGKPIAVGPYSISNYAMEAKKNQEIALENSKEVILEVAEKFKELSGRGFGLFEEYRTEDADYIMLLMGSAAGTAKQAVDEMREQGKKVGVLKLRVFRPFHNSACKICEESDRKGIPFLQSARRKDWFNNIDLHAVVQRDLRMVEIHPHQFIAYGPADRISAVDRSQPEKFIEFVDCSVSASDSEITVQMVLCLKHLADRRLEIPV